MPRMAVAYHVLPNLGEMGTVFIRDIVVARARRMADIQPCAAGIRHFESTARYRCGVFHEDITLPIVRRPDTMPGMTIACHVRADLDQTGAITIRNVMVIKARDVAEIHADWAPER